MQQSQIALRKEFSGNKALVQGFRPVYSGVYVRDGAKREVAFKPGSKCVPSVKKLAHQYFDCKGILQPIAYLKFEDFNVLSQTYSEKTSRS